MRIRTVKPEFFLHDGLFDLEHETGLPIRVAFIGLWCAADREGRFRWEPRRLGALILPYDGVDFSRVLDALVTRGFLVRYTSQGHDFGCIPTFSRHQIVNNRETPSSIPTPPDQNEIAVLTRATRVPDACPTRHDLDKGEREGEREGERNKLPPKPPHDESATTRRIPVSAWSPLQEHRDLCAVRNVDCDLQLSRFRERNNGQEDTDQGWGVRFRQWLGRSRPERALPAEAVASPTMQEWIDYARTVNNHGDLGKWPREAAEAGWEENQAKGWKWVSDWQADCRARAKRWAANEATQAQRRR
jgi:hypothetical protein